MEGNWREDVLFELQLGEGLFEDHNVFLNQVDTALKRLDLKPSAAELKLIVSAVSWRVEDAARVINKVHKPGKAKPDPLRGLHEEWSGIACYTVGVALGLVLEIKLWAHR